MNLCYVRAVRRNPDRPEPNLRDFAMLTLNDVLREAQKRLTAGDGRGALDIYRQILDREPTNSEALLGALRAAMAAGNAAAIETAQRQLEQIYSNAGAMTQLAVAQAQFKAGVRLLDEAATAAERALAIDSSLPEVESLAFVIGRHLGKYPQFFSQFGQDRYLNQHVFENKRDGVFVDVGAYDGLTGSNTLFFEKFQGWRGICIEPDGAQYAKLSAVRSCECVQACIADRDSMARFLSVTDGLTMMGGLVDHYEPGDLKMVSERSGSRIINLATRRLDAVLNEHNVTAIDYLSVDTEGSELAILRSLDFARFKVRALSVENNRNLPQIPDHMRSAGYSRIARLGVDDIYVKDGAN
jgi:FkbM family methyltransferase